MKRQERRESKLGFIMAITTAVVITMLAAGVGPF